MNCPLTDFATVGASTAEAVWARPEYGTDAKAAQQASHADQRRRRREKFTRVGTAAGPSVQAFFLAAGLAAGVGVGVGVGAGLDSLFASDLVSVFGLAASASVLAAVL